MQRTKPRQTQTPRGEANGNSRLTVGIIDEAKRLRATGSTYVALAERYGVSEATIRRAVSGRSWRA